MAVMVTVPVRFRVFDARSRVSSSEFLPFLPKEVEKIRDPPARELAKRIQRLPVNVSFSNNSIMSSCVKPLQNKGAEPIVLLHGFDSSCLEWRYTYPLLEDAGLETWALDILGWGFSDLAFLPPCDVAAKREHLYQFWRLYIERPMVLVGPSLGAAVAIDFAANYPEAVALLKSFPLRIYAISLAFNKISFSECYDWTNVGRLHCLLPWWEDATVDFMVSGGYKIKHKTLILWGENDRIISDTFAQRLNADLPNSVLHQIPECGHLPHIEKPKIVSDLIEEFLQGDHGLINHIYIF